MKAVQLERPEALRYVDVPEPDAPCPGDAVVRSMTAFGAVEDVVRFQPTVRTDATYNRMSAAFSEEIAKLRETITVPIRTWDERLTSVQAQRLLREAGHKAKDQKGKVDATAAAVLLQSYLDSQGG